MKLLLDTNVFLEIILEQQRSGEAISLLEKTQDHEFFITDFSLHSIGLLLFRRNQHDAFQKFLRDVTIEAETEVISVPALQMDKVVDVALRFHLDFDDAYQYVAGEMHELTLVSFDTDFDRTSRGKKTPREVLER